MCNFSYINTTLLTIYFQKSECFEIFSKEEFVVIYLQTLVCKDVYLLNDYI